MKKSIFKIKEQNINKILYDECFGDWIWYEPVEQLILLYGLDWEYLWDKADKEKVLDKKTVFDRIIAIDKEIESRGIDE